MLEKPDVEDGKIVACLLAGYRLRAEIAFLPLGADLNTAVYRAVTPGGPAYFVKLRRGAFDETAVALPRFLSDQGVGHIITPLPTVTGALWAALDGWKVILYPFVTGRDGYEVALPDDQWRELGAALKRIHTVALPPELKNRIRQETYPPWGRDTIRAYLERIERGEYEAGEPVAVRVAALLRARRAETLDLVGRAERLAAALRARPPEFVLCHSDLHAGNVLIEPGGGFYLVDWDEPILAPKERDLMYAGGGLMGGWRRPEEEERLFYQGYGPAPIDDRALAYYRYERIVQDIAVYCVQLLGSSAGGEDREQSLRYLESNFLPGHTIEIAYRGDRTQSHGRDEIGRS